MLRQVLSSAVRNVRTGWYTARAAASTEAADSRPAPVASGKRKTNIVGYDPIEPFDKAKGMLVDLYGQILRELQDIPEKAGYRVIVETTTKHRLQVVNEESTYEGIESRIGTGLVEELVEQARDELDLIPKIAQWKPWELPENHPGPQVITDKAAAKEAEIKLANSTQKPLQDQPKK